MADEPKEGSEPNSISRRTFVNVVLGGSAAGLAAAVLYPVAQFVQPPDVAESTTEVAVAAHEGDLKPGEWKIFPMGANPGILVCKAVGEYYAFSAVCTHLSCTVQYRADFGQIWCPCHNGRFDLNGRNVGGPPPRPLEQFAVNLRGDEIVVSRRAS